MADKTVLITGSTGGLGATLVKRLVAEYRCVVTYRAANKWAALQAEVGANDRLHGIEADVTDEAAITRAANEIRDQHGPLYGIVHMASNFAGGSVEATSLDAWNDLLKRNLTSAFLVIHTLLPQLKQHGAGRIITMGSAAALARPAGLIGYTVAKSGLQVLSEALARELQDTRITVNTVLPGSMATAPMLAQMSSDKLVPLAYVVNTIAFLLSEAGGGITGASIPVTVTGAI